MKKFVASAMAAAMAVSLAACGSTSTVLDPIARQYVVHRISF